MFIHSSPRFSNRETKFPFKILLSRFRTSEIDRISEEETVGKDSQECLYFTDRNGRDVNVEAEGPGKLFGITVGQT